MLKVLDDIFGYALLVWLELFANDEISSPWPLNEIALLTISFMQNLKNSKFEQVLMVSTHELPLKRVLEEVFDLSLVRWFFQPLDNLLEDLEEVHPSFVLKVGSFTFDIIHVVSDLVFVATKSWAEPVQAIFHDVLRSIEVDEIGDDLQACNPLAGILVDQFNLLLDFAEFNRSLQKREDACNTWLHCRVDTLFLRFLRFFTTLLRFQWWFNIRLVVLLVQELQWNLQFYQEFWFLFDFHEDLIKLFFEPIECLIQNICFLVCCELLFLALLLWNWCFFSFFGNRAINLVLFGLFLFLFLLFEDLIGHFCFIFQR